jgi:hypothetical protein
VTAGRGLARRPAIVCPQCRMPGVGYPVHKLDCPLRYTLLRPPLGTQWPRDPALVVSALLES